MLLAQLILTLVTLGFSAIPMRADFNKTHATNPLWTPHARFHVVWQVSSFVGIAGVALALIWWPGERAIERLWLAMSLAGAIYSGFFVALFCMKLYGGSEYDPNGYPPKYWTIFGRRIGFDANVALFSLMLVLIIGAVAAVTGIQPEGPKAPANPGPASDLNFSTPTVLAHQRR